MCLFESGTPYLQFNTFVRRAPRAYIRVLVHSNQAMANTVTSKHTHTTGATITTTIDNKTEDFLSKLSFAFAARNNP